MSALAVFGLAVIGLSYRALTDVRSEVDNLARLRHPLMAAAHEIEVNVNGLGLAVLAYLERPRPAYREWAGDDIRDIERFLQVYASLAPSEGEQQLADAMRIRLKEFVADGIALLSKSDEMTATLAELAECIEEVDALIHAWVDRADAQGPSRRAHNAAGVRAVLTVEAELAEIGMALATWQSPISTQTRRAKYVNRLADLKRLVTLFERLPFAAEERRAASQIIQEQRKVAGLIDRTMTLEDDMDTLRERFIEERTRLDRLLDDEVQALAHAGLDLPLRAVDQVSETAVQLMGYVALPLFGAFTLTMGLLLYRGITQPLLALKKGLRTLAQGGAVQPIVGLPNDEFGDLATEFNRMTQQLRDRSEEITGKDAELWRREAMASMGSLVSGVAHEVRNPLFGITSTLDALQARLHGLPEQARHIAVLRGETARLQKLMQDLLDYGKPTPHIRVAANLYAVIGSAVAACLPQARERDVHIVCETHGPAPLIELDAQRIEQVFVNLIENALHHSEPGAGVDVGAWHDTSSDPPTVVCTVSDQGTGFRPEDLARVFEPFYTRRRGGTGLGLSIVQRIVDEHGGTIAAANGTLGGAVLTLRLPFTAVAAGSAAANDAHAKDDAVTPRTDAELASA